MNEKRALSKKSDWLIIGIVLLVLLMLIFLPDLFSKAGETAVISVDGVVVATVDLAAAEDGDFRIDELPDVVFTVKEGKIAITSVDCPDKLCVRTGYISNGDESIICLPNRIIVQIEGEASFDAIVN